MGRGVGTARKALTYIAAKKDAAGTWGTTQATIMALRALLLATEKGAADVRGTVEVLLNGKPVEETGAHAGEQRPAAPVRLQETSTRRAPTTVELRFDGKGGLAYQVVGSYFVPWDRESRRASRSRSTWPTTARTWRRTISPRPPRPSGTICTKSANMVMVDLGIPPGFDLLSEDLQDYQEKSAGHQERPPGEIQPDGHAGAFSTSIRSPRETLVTLNFRLRAKYPIRARTFQSRVYEYYDPEVSSVARPVQLEVRKR